MFDLPYDVMAIGKYAVTFFSSLSKLANKLSSHELYIYAITQDMHQNFAPKLNGRYLSSNVNITVADQDGNPVSVPVGGTCFLAYQRFMLVSTECSLTSCRAVREVQDSQVSTCRGITARLARLTALQLD